MSRTITGTTATATEVIDAREDQQIRRLYELTGDLLAIFGRGGYFMRLNPAWERVLGWTREELMSVPIWDLVHPSDLHATQQLGIPSPPGEVSDFTTRLRHRDGGWRWLQWTAHFDGQAWYAAARDVSERMRLEHQALHDPLTRLPNRLLFVDRAKLALARLHRHGGVLALLFIDLDHFKRVNDSRGHAVGDTVLLSVAHRLLTVVRETDTVARLGGDEFVILAEELDDPADAVALAERTVAAFETPFALGSGEVRLSASVGIAVTDDAEKSTDQLLREADVAMYRAKWHPGGASELFDAHVRREVAVRLEVERRLRNALARGELSVVYQPLVRLAGEDAGAVVGCEALLRWCSADGEIEPETFLPLAEDNGLIVPFGEWVMRTACAQSAAWRRRGRDLGVAVNVSPRQLAQRDFVEVVRSVLESTGLPPASLTLEITETAMLHDPDRVAHTLRRIRQLGVRTAIDDFGSGFSSLSHLITLPVDVLKIDRSFVAALERRDGARAVILAVMAVAREMGLTVVAEGIETSGQLTAVRELGCHIGQGYELGPPQAVPRLANAAYVANSEA